MSGAANGAGAAAKETQDVMHPNQDLSRVPKWVLTGVRESVGSGRVVPPFSAVAPPGREAPVDLANLCERQMREKENPSQHSSSDGLDNLNLGQTLSRTAAIRGWVGRVSPWRRLWSQTWGKLGAIPEAVR